MNVVRAVATHSVELPPYPCFPSCCAFRPALSVPLLSLLRFATSCDTIQQSTYPSTHSLSTTIGSDDESERIVELDNVGILLVKGTNPTNGHFCVSRCTV